MPKRLGVGGTDRKDYGARCKSCGKMATPRHWFYYRVGDKDIETCQKCFDQLTKSPGRKSVKQQGGQMPLWQE